jgi:hypothetical protein
MYETKREKNINPIKQLTVPMHTDRRKLSVVMQRLSAAGDGHC